MVSGLLIMFCCCVGYEPTVALSRPVGRQSFRLGRAAVSDVPAVSYVRAVHAFGVDSGAGLLRSFGRVPRKVCDPLFLNMEQ